MRVTLLGCGTSGGVPTLPLDWGLCDPNNAKNRRTRASVHVETDSDQSLIIDTTPDFHRQCLAAQIDRVDAVLYTHDHADHCHGIDDLRGYFREQGVPIPLYGDQDTLAGLKDRFTYVFESRQGYPVIAKAHAFAPTVKAVLAVGGDQVHTFAQQHGAQTSYGFRIGDFAYSTDLNGLSEAAFEALRGVRVWIVDALMRQPHPTHAHLDLTLSWIERVKPERAILTHMDKSMDYDTLQSELPMGVEPGYDGLVIEL